MEAMRLWLRAARRCLVIAIMYLVLVYVGWNLGGWFIRLHVGDCP